MIKYDSPRGFCHSNAVIDRVCKIYHDDKKVNEYLDFIENCHFAVDCFLEKYPDIDAKFRTEGFRYYDILKMANEDLYNRISIVQRKFDEDYEEYKKGMLNWLGVHCTSEIDPNDEFIRTLLK